MASNQAIETERQIAFKNRRVTIMQTLKVPLRAPTGEVIGLIGLAFDIGEKRKLEEALRQSQKLEAVGQLAGGVAHDFNNILTSIMAGVDLALPQVPAGSPLAAELQDIQRAAERAAQITRQLLFLSRSKSAEKRSLNANDIAVAISKMLRRLLGEDITLELKLSDRPPTILADPTQVEQVLLNLALNARDAMPTGGTLSIRTEIAADAASAAVGSAVGAHSSAPSSTVPTGNLPHLLLTVSDTGTGIAPEIQDRILDLFFTTKKDRGSGLGLSVVQGIVKEHQGQLWYETEVGKGTSFHVALPLVSGTSAAERGHGPKSALLSGDETVLVVEDDEAVRVLTERVLSMQGYRVVAAGSGAEALQVAETMSPPPALLLSDVVMPGMNGFDLAHSLVERLPSLKVLLVSGYPDKAIGARAVSPNGYRILAKPYTPAALTQAIREMLDG
jgi:signal transduction histidine kinase/CheY-like chemotaxis protein